MTSLNRTDIDAQPEGAISVIMRDRNVALSLILKKLSAYRQQNGVAAALQGAPTKASSKRC